MIRMFLRLVELAVEFIVAGFLIVLIAVLINFLIVMMNTL